MRSDLQKHDLAARESKSWKSKDEKAAILRTFKDLRARDVAEQILDLVEDHWAAKKDDQVLTLTFRRV